MISGNMKRLLVPVLRNGIQQTRNQSVVSGPPQVHVPKAEKYALGLGMAFCLLFTPAWVVLHINEYKKPK